MRALLVVAILAVSAVARADDAAATRDLVVEYKRLARELALHGNCAAARELAERVRALDPAYHEAELAPDLVIAFCTAPGAPVPSSSIEPPGEPRPAVSREPIRRAPTERPAIPPISADRIIVEVVVGSVSSLLGIVGGGLIGLAACTNDSGEFDCLGKAILGAYVGGVAMLSVGVYVGGRDREQTGSLGATVLGGMLGAGIGVGAALALRNDDAGLLVALLAGAPMVGAIVGFTRTRRWKQPTAPRIGSLFRFDRDGVALGIPLVVHGEQRGAATTSVTLVSGAF